MCSDFFQVDEESGNLGSDVKVICRASSCPIVECYAKTCKRRVCQKHGDGYSYCYHRHGRYQVELQADVCVHGNCQVSSCGSPFAGAGTL